MTVGGTVVTQPFLPFCVFFSAWAETVSFARSFFRNVHVVRFSGKDVRMQSQVFVLFRSEVEEQITVRFSRRVFICFHGELPLLWVHLTRQICKLTRVSRVLEQNHVMRVETHGSRKLVFRKQILSEKHHAHVPMV